MTVVTTQEPEVKRSRFRSGSRSTKMDLIAIIAAFVILFSLAATPYVMNNSFQNTGYVVSSVKISYNQVPNPINLYLSPSGYYVLDVIQQIGNHQTFAVISEQGQLPTGSLVFVNSQTAQWYVQSSPPPIPADGQTYNQVIVGSVSSVSNSPFANFENWLSQTTTGTLVLEISTVLSFLGPLLFIFAVKYVTKRFVLWSVVIAVWFYALIYFVPGVLGASYGLSISSGLAAVLGILLFVAYIANKLEIFARERLAAKSVSVQRS